MAKSKWSQNVVTELKAPNFGAEMVAKYAEFSTRILWMDKNVVSGAFQMSCNWYREPNSEFLGYAHKHEADEIIGFFGPDYKKPHDLGAEIELWIEDEKFIITKSAMIFVPANVMHCPIILKRVDQPIFNFSVLTSGIYSLQK